MIFILVVSQTQVHSQLGQNQRAKRFPSQMLKTVIVKRKEAEIDNLTKLVAAPRFLKLL